VTAPRVMQAALFDCCSAGAPQACRFAQLASGFLLSLWEAYISTQPQMPAMGMGRPAATASCFTDRTEGAELNRFWMSVEGRSSSPC